MSALDRLLEFALAQPCERGAPLLHRLVDGELSRRHQRRARAHLRGCSSCRTHVRWLELQEQTLREIAAPTPARLLALWSDRLHLKMAGAVAQEAGDALLRFVLEERGVGVRGAAGGRPAERLAHVAHYLPQLADWLGMALPPAGPLPGDSVEPPGALGELISSYECLLGADWPPARAVRALLGWVAGAPLAR